MSSDVCKHCTEAACLDVCPTGALFRTEFGTVVVQDDVCNGCGYCVPACPFGVIARREEDGQAHKCTLCYDRLGDGLEPACAKACPTAVHPVRPAGRAARAGPAPGRGAARGRPGQARLYLDDPADGIGGGGAFFLLLDEPEVYGLPPDPVVTTRDLPGMWKHVAIAAAGLAGTGGRARPGQAAVTRARAPGGRQRRRGRRRGARAAHGARRRVHLLLRPPGDQGAGVAGAGRGRVPVLRRPGRRLVGAGGRRRTCPATATWPGWPS